MHLETLRLYCDVVRLRSFSKGAEQNFVSQSAASQAVQQLETQVGATLIDRTKRPFAVTPQGVGFEFDSPLKVGLRYPISLSAPGVSFTSTLEVTRCRLTVQPEGRYFQIEGKFFPYVE